MPLDADWAIGWTRRAAELVVENRPLLTALDAAIGDADHGYNLERGFRAAVARLDAQVAEGIAPDNPGAVLKSVATTLITTVGGAAGPLVGTAFLRASRVGDAPELSSQDVADLLSEASAGVSARGRAETGDKTMVDAWHPAALAAQAAAQEGASPAQVLRRAAQAAAQGAEDTEPMTARKGRASYLGPRSQGHRDPGAQSSALIIQAAADAADATA